MKIVMAKKRKIVSMNRRPQARLDVGTLIFIVIFLILMVHFVRYLFREHISFYEVTEKSIADDNVCQGIILRDETIITTDKEGYISYYVGDGERVGKNAPVYSLDENGDIFELLTSEETDSSMNKKDWYEVRSDITQFRKDYDDSNYSAVSDFKYDMENTMLELKNVNMLKNIKSILKANGKSDSFKIVKSTQSGVISYCFDGMEDLTADDITTDSFRKKDYQRTQLRSSQQVTSGAAVYKMVSEESWEVVVELTQSQYEKLSDKEKINITFVKDNLSTTAGVSCYEKEEHYFAVLSLDKYMIQYLNERYIEVELSINSAEGLKIPNSSIVTRSFYKIPKAYYRENEDGQTGVYREVYQENGEMEAVFTQAEKMYEDEKNVYIDTEAVPSGSVLHREDSEKTYVVAQTKDIEGVYNVNNGYCVFRRIEKVYENSDYTIVAKETEDGISVYDHIVLNASLVEDGDIIY
jgi:hypothetical protein